MQVTILITSTILGTCPDQTMISPVFECCSKFSALVYSKVSREWDVMRHSTTQFTQFNKPLLTNCKWTIKKGKRCWPSLWGRQAYSDNLEATQTMTKCFRNSNKWPLLVEEIGESFMKGIGFWIGPKSMD